VKILRIMVEKSKEIQPSDSSSVAMVTGVILAGGEARRMGGSDKGFVTLLGRYMVEHVIERFHPQVSTLVISANRSQSRYRALGYEIVPDGVEDFSGPLAGMASAAGEAGTTWLATVPCDAPLLPLDLVARLLNAVDVEGRLAAVARVEGYRQPVFNLVSTTLAASLAEAVKSGECGVGRWLGRHQAVEVDFSDCTEHFANINTPGERDRIARRLEDG